MSPEEALRAYPLPTYGTGKVPLHMDIIRDGRGMRTVDMWSMEISWPLDDDVTPQRVTQALESVLVRLNADVEDAATAVGVDPRTVETSAPQLGPYQERRGRGSVFLYARIERTTARR